MNIPRCHTHDHRALLNVPRLLGQQQYVESWGTARECHKLACRLLGFLFWFLQCRLSVCAKTLCLIGLYTLVSLGLALQLRNTVARALPTRRAC